MAVNALELRPRGAVALFDAAIRVCATSTGVWALTLPAGGALIAALFNLAEAIQHHQPLFIPVAWWTAAWVFRAISQGAACHYLEQEIIGASEPSARASFKAALKRAPSLVTASAYLAVLNGVIWTFTAGIGFLFLGAHAAGYAATMRGQGSVLGLYGTCSKLLGPARHSAPWVRVLGFTQFFLAWNLHLVSAVALYLANKLFGFDVVFLDRFASLDNGTWVATVVVTTFALFEPLRAATGTLLLVDGRVRQEGLDLLASVEQLPLRRKPKSTPIVAAALALLLFPLAARAQEASTSLSLRVKRVVRECQMRGIESREVQALDESDPRDKGALSRFVSRVERTAWDKEDCESAEADLREGLKLISELRAAGASDPASARDAAKSILARPEFQQFPDKPKEDKPPEDEEAPSAFSKWWDEFWRKLWEWLRRREHDDDHEPIHLDAPTTSPMMGANVVMIGALAVVAAVLIYILVRSLKKKDPSEVELDEQGAVNETALTDDPMSALSRPPETWAGLADELAAKGHFREAIRHLYLALLSRLHREGVIDYDPTKSNWEYLLAFKGGGDTKTAFRELTRRFDFAWYGNLGIDALAYAMFRKVAEPLLAHRAEGAEARA